MKTFCAAFVSSSGYNRDEDNTVGKDNPRGSKLFPNAETQNSQPPTLLLLPETSMGVLGAFVPDRIVHEACTIPVLVRGIMWRCCMLCTMRYTTMMYCKKYRMIYRI